MTKKKWLILLPNLLGMVGLPTISLASCGCKKPEEPIEKPSFTVANSTMDTDNIHAPIALDWTPSDHSITFSSFSFKYNNGSESAAQVHQRGDDGDRPVNLYLDLGKEVEKNIVDGELGFHYVDNTTASEGDATVRSIHINKVPEIVFDFTVQPSQMSSANEANINLNWTPADRALTFYAFNFSYTYAGSSKDANVSTVTSSAGTQVLKLAFPEEIVDEDISDGKLSFKYTDNVSSQSGTGIVTNINITKFEQEIDFNFYVSHSQMSENETTTIDLNWTPNNRTLSFESESLTFKYASGTKTASVEIVSNAAGTQSLKLTFEEAIITSDIDDGVLSFHYTDTISSQEGDASVEDIYISKYEETDIRFEFSVEESEMESERQANINLRWTPEDTELQLSDITFTYDNGDESAEVSQVSEESGSQTLCLSFDQDITQSDITDGILRFHYQYQHDDSVQEADWFVNNIIIKKFVPQIQFDFSVPNSRMSLLQYASIKLNWTPSDRPLDLSNFSFKYNGGTETANVGSVSTNGAGSQTLSLSFNHDITESDIDDGVLTFHYKDPASLQEDDVTINDIYIYKFVEEIEFEFSVKSEAMSSKTEASIDLKWTPNDQILEVSNPEFKYDKGQKNATVTLESAESGSQKLKLVFEEDIGSEIVDGDLSFHYKNDTLQEGDGRVDAIKIQPFVSPFEEDDWENVCYWASKGLNDLKQHYRVDSFVGKTKDIIVDGYKYQLQVIGENEDYRANNDGTASEFPVALTFMFKTAIQEYDSETSSYKPLLVDFTTEENYWEDDIWQFSIPKQYLDETFLPKLEEALGVEEAEGIKTVSKNTINALPNGNVVAKGEKLFLPSLADFFSSEQETFQLPEISPDIENQDAYIQEGRKYIKSETEHYARYSYFEQKVLEDYSHPHPELCVYDGSGEGSQGISYWLRSCYPTKDLEDGRNEWICYYGEDVAQKGMFWTMPIMSEPDPLPPSSFALAPIFCI